VGKKDGHAIPMKYRDVPLNRINPEFTASSIPSLQQTPPKTRRRYPSGTFHILLKLSPIFPQIMQQARRECGRNAFIAVTK
jgi:hypothetical protein